MIRLHWGLILLTGAAAIAATGKPAEPARVVRPFNGKNLDGWKLRGPADRSHWVVGIARLDPKRPSALLVQKIPSPGTEASAAQLINAQGRGVDIYTEKKFGDCRVELEVMVPKGSNSGIYLMGEYEIQVFDSYGKERIGPGDLGAIYGAAVARVNAAKKPGEWQKFIIDFEAPRFANGKKVSNARFRRVVLNGKVIHENVEVAEPTPSCLTGEEQSTGPLLLQGDHGPVAYRNIKIVVR